MRDELRGLTRALPLPPGFDAPVLFADTVDVAGVRVHRAGIQVSAPGGAEVTGSAAELDGSPVARAYFELLERAAVFDAATRSCPIRDASGAITGVAPAEPPAESPSARARVARSNGVALHRTWEEACRRARLELTERDRVLGAWHCALPLAPIDPPDYLSKLDRTHRWVARSIPSSTRGTDAEVVVVVVGFPREPSVPLARGFAAAATLAEAATAAAREAIQSLAFVWGEPIPTEPPELAPTPLFHLDYYLWPGSHEHLREWLERSDSAPDREEPSDETRYVDLTPPSFGERLYVARAVRASARRLTFGEAPAELRATLPPSRHVHPIP